MKRDRLPLVVGAVLILGCQRSQLSTHYDVQGFYVFPLKQVLLGMTPDEVRQVLGEPTKTYRAEHRQPNRIVLDRLPSFEEQWGYFEGLANNWVFYQGGKVVAAFREESDW